MIRVTIRVAIQQYSHVVGANFQHYTSEDAIMDLEPADFNSVAWHMVLGRAMDEVVRHFNDKVYSEEDAIPSK